MQRQAVILGSAAAILLGSSWLFAGLLGLATAMAGMAFGWLVRHLSVRREIASGTADLRSARSDAAALPDVTARLQALDAKTSSLRHDLRGILSPALLTAERLLGNEDPIVRRAGEVMVKTVERASARLAETKG